MRLRRPLLRPFFGVMTVSQPPPPPPPPNWFKMMTATTVGIMAAEWATDLYKQRAKQ